MSFGILLEKAAQYAAAWSSNNPEEVAKRYAHNGPAILNAGEPIQGRTSNAEDYGAPFFRDFPDSTVLMHDFRLFGNHGLFTGMLVAPPYRGSLRFTCWVGKYRHLMTTASFSHLWFDREEHARQVR
ncbi:MAG: hypothetical protein AB3N24_03475 [Leisingera sp.]